MDQLPHAKLPSIRDPSNNTAHSIVASPESHPSSDTLDVLAALRKALTEDTNPPAQIIHAATEFARILTGANGVALALRMNGTVVCRARSGDIAPELGVPLNTESGISGECLRTATVLLCNDAETDPRVNPEACHALGIRSMVAVPLHGPSGIAGILEAFSTRANAFDAGAIDSLRGLAEIAETGYARECAARQATRSAKHSETIRSTLFAATTVPERSLPNEIVRESSPARHYQIVGLATIALLLTSLVAWFSWSDSAPELAAGEPSAPLHNSPKDVSPTPLRTAPLKPPPGIATARHEPMRPAGVLQNAAEIENAEADRHSADSTRDLSGALHFAETKQSAVQSPATEPPPAIEVAVLDSPSKLTGLSSEPAALPKLEPRVSQGITEAILIHKVDPIYPPQARMLRLNGSVTLDATIAENGTVRGIKVVSGSPVLAAAATEAVRKWSYSPSLLNGTPIEVHKQITVVFKLP